jgi:hypothetical protein
MSPRILRIALFGIVIATAWEYARWTYDTSARAEAIVLALEDRPYVYRALVPFVARQLWIAGVPAILALRALVVLSAIGLVYALEYLFRSLRK